MARRKDKEKAIKLRLQGCSYSQIKEKLGVSKSTLSGWLSDYPLSPERIKKLRDWNPRRIENFRNTMRKKRETRLQKVYYKVKKDISKLSKRDTFIAGLFLYWGEGSKTFKCETALSNTDPAVLKFFIKWMDLLGIPKDKLRVKLQLYSDMDIEEETFYWSKKLGMSIGSFKKPYIKKSKFSKITYKKDFSHGTCVVSLGNRDISEYVLMGIKSIQDIYS